MVTNRESKNEIRKMDRNHLFLNFHQLGSRTHLGLSVKENLQIPLKIRVFGVLPTWAVSL